MTAPTWTLLAVLPQQPLALLFVNYLSTKQINAKVLPTDQLTVDAKLPARQFAILCSNNHLEQAKQEFALFILDPHNTKYQDAAWESAKTDEITESQTSITSVFADNLIRHAGPVTLSVLTLSWIIFILANIGFGQVLFSALQFKPDLTEPWRLFGPALFHLGLLHIAFNTLWWWQLGGEVEQKLSSFSLLNIFAISALTSNVGQYLVSGANFAGLSGVVYALVGYVWWTGWLAPSKGLTLAKPLVGFMLIWLVLGFTDIMAVNIANTAHLVGLITGCLLALISNKQSK
jgi:GlpG protein